jgi:type IV pilus assembly protein PilN
MPNINLLPWREEQREELKQVFFIVIGVCASAALVLLLVGWMGMQSSLDYQNSRNSYLNKEIKRVEAQVRKIKKLKAQRSKMLSRMKVIQNLQGNRPVIVNVFDELVKIVPDGVHFKKININGKTIGIKGAAESNNRVASLMRNVDDSKWFTRPNLTQVTANKKLGSRANNFSMSMKLSLPSDRAKARKAWEAKKVRNAKKAKKANAK